MNLWEQINKRCHPSEQEIDNLILPRYSGWEVIGDVVSE